MAKNKSINIDFKQLAVQYGDRVGLGVAVFLAVLFVIWGFSGVSSNPLSASQVKEAKSSAKSHMDSFPVKEEELEPANTRKDVKRVSEIAALSESKKESIPVGTLATQFSWVWQPAQDDVSRSRPEVFTPVKLIGVGVDLAWKQYEVRGGRITVAQPREGVKITGTQSGDKSRVKGAGSAGTGMAGAGVEQPKEKDKQDKPKEPEKQRWTAKDIEVESVTDKDIFAVHIWPARAAYVVGIFPYARQINELNRALKEDSSLKSYFKELQIQRRELVTKGTRLADGAVVAQDMVLVPDPADPGKRIMKPYVDLPSKPMREDEIRAAGWIDVDIGLQETLTEWSTESWQEPDPVLASLIRLGGRLNRRLPRPVRGDFPPLQNDLPELKALIEKIKKDNTPIEEPRLDPRLDKDRRNQYEDDGASPPPGGARGSNPLAGNTAGPGGQRRTTEAPPASSGPPEYSVVRFLDVTLADESIPVGGRTFEYRVRVVMTNPNFGEKNVAVPEFAREKELHGDWSAPVRVTFSPSQYLYADERQREGGRKNDSADLDRVPIQVHKWIGFFAPNVEATSQRRMGAWWVDRILAARGEYIGRVPTDKKHGEASLIDWLHYVPEDNDVSKMGVEVIDKFRTASLMTRSLLVDFEGGQRTYNTRFKRLNSNRFEDEDVPAELLILEPDGKLCARSLLKDQTDESRDRRYTAWKEWYDHVANRTGKPEAKDAADKNKPGSVSK